MKRDTSWRMLVAAVFVFLLVPWVARAAIDPTKVQKLVAGDGTAHDEFGWSVAVDGNTAVIGAAFASPGGLWWAGAAYVFTRAADGTWSEQQKLTASDAAEVDLFGGSVSVSGDTVLIGANYADPGGLTVAGAAYVFTRSGGIWTERQKLTASDAAALDRFGHSVSVSGDTAVIGAIHVDESDISAVTGAAYMFTRAADGTWSEQQKLTASDATANDWFGYSVSVSGDTAVIGGHAASYVFTRAADGTWSEQQKLTASDAGAEDWFGISVSVSGDTVLIGANYADPGGLSDAGAAYVFVRSGASWTQQAKLTAVDGAIQDWFGYSVSVSEDTAVIGAIWAGLSDAGAAYVFTRAADGTWSEQQKLTASDIAAADYLGTSVSVSGDTAVIGAYGASPGGLLQAGAAYVFGSAPVVLPCSTDGLLQEAMAAIKALPLSAFKTMQHDLDTPDNQVKRAQRAMQRSLVNQINTAITRVKRRQYAAALRLLQRGILVKTDGCAKAGAPDKNDWLKDCADQATVYALLMEAIECLESMI